MRYAKPKRNHFQNICVAVWGTSEVLLDTSHRSWQDNWNCSGVI